MHIHAIEVIEKRQVRPGQKCVCFGNLCFCDKCLYLFGAAVTIFAMAAPAALMSMGSDNSWLSTALTALAGLSFSVLAFALGVNFVSAWKGKHYQAADQRPH
jgi:hypothetical protein